MPRSDTSELEYDTDLDIDSLTDGSDRNRDHDGDRERGTTNPGSKPSEGTGGGLRSRLPSPSLPSLGAVSARGIGLSLVASLVGFLAASFFLPLGGVAGLVGLFAVGFLLGAVGRRRYLELGLAGAGTAAVGTLLSQFFVAAVADLAVPFLAIGGTAGFVAAVLGHYFGRDLRAGLTRDVGDPGAP